MVKKLLLKVVLSCLGGALMGVAITHGQSSWQDYGGAKPIDVIHDVVKNDDTDVIETQLDRVSGESGFFGANFKIANTLDSVRQNLDIYMERIAFIGLSAAVVLIVYNGLRLVLSPLSDSEIQKTKQRLLYIILGVLVLTGFYFILTILLNIVLDIAV